MSRIEQKFEFEFELEFALELEPHFRLDSLSLSLHSLAEPWHYAGGSVEDYEEESKQAARIEK